MRKLFLLTGEGIECEKESARAFQDPALGFEVQNLLVPELLKNPFLLDNAKKGDLFFLPGGFSFADHFGSGKLMAYQLNKIKFFDKILQVGAHLMGVCNGFQVLMAAGLFPNLRLDHNLNMTFHQRWVRCHLNFANTEKEVTLLCRHGEGRLSGKAVWGPFLKPFLFYQDENFNNGSLEQVAGLHARIKQSHIFGMMPHPEIAMRGSDHPNRFGVEYVLSDPTLLKKEKGDGFFVLNEICQMIAEEK